MTDIIDMDGRQAHLRDDAPTAVCRGCGRKSVALREFGKLCGFPQPDGTRCEGVFSDPGDIGKILAENDRLQAAQAAHDGELSVLRRKLTATQSELEVLAAAAPSPVCEVLVWEPGDLTKAGTMIAWLSAAGTDYSYPPADGAAGELSVYNEGKIEPLTVRPGDALVCTPAGVYEVWRYDQRADYATRARTVAGFCPMGCGEHLVCAAHGRIVCSWHLCPRPAAVDELLADTESEHIVEMRDTGYSIRHPQRERLGDALLSCQLDAHLVALDEPPRPPGCYRAVFDEPAGGWSWEELGS